MYHIYTFNFNLNLPYNKIKGIYIYKGFFFFFCHLLKNSQGNFNL